MISQSFIFNIIHYSAINQHYRLFPRKLDTIVLTNKKQQIIHDSLLLMHSLYHQHNPSFCFDKHIGITTDNGINLFGRNRLSILTDMQSLAINHFRNLFSSHPPVLSSEAVKYGFFDFHILLDNISFL